MKIGMGFDIHRLVRGRKFVLGGVTIPHSKGPLGHSDGDALTHAAIDALLGAAGLGDIGDHFPDTDPRWRGASSVKLLEAVAVKISRRGFRVLSVDAVILADAPRLSPHKERMRKNLAAALGISASDIGVKAKTMEGLGPIGAGKAVGATCVALLEKKRGSR